LAPKVLIQFNETALLEEVLLASCFPSVLFTAMPERPFQLIDRIANK